MKHILITYDLKKPGQSYDELRNTIKEFGTEWRHFLESTWIIKTNKSVTECINALKIYLDVNDRLFVVDITGSNCEGRLPREARNWLNKPI